MRPLLPLLLLLTSACSAGDSHTAADPVAAIDFSLPALDGSSVNLSDYRSQWVVVNYWATWCAPCRKEIPDLSSLHDERDDVTVLGLAYEDAEPQSFLDFLQDYPATYPILITDTYNPPEALGPPMALPTTFLVNPQGEIVERFLGPVTREKIEEAITTHL